MKPQRLGARRTRGISTIAGTIIFITVALVLLGVYLASMTALEKTGEIVSKLVESRAKSLSITACTSGWWLQEGDTLTINLTVSCPTPVTITALVVQLDNNTIIYATRENSTLENIEYTTITASGNTINGPLSLPHTLPTPSTTNITVGGIEGAKVLRVSLAATSSPGITVIPLKNYYQLYPPTPINITPQPTPKLAASLSRIAGLGTVTWSGKTIGLKPEGRRGDIVAARVIAGSLVSGDSSSLEAVDGNQYIIEANKTIKKVNDTVLFYDDFSDNPFTRTQHRLIDYTGDWNYDPNQQAIYVNHVLYTSFGPVRSSSLAYYSDITLGQQNGSRIQVLVNLWPRGELNTTTEQLLPRISSLALVYSRGSIVYGLNISDTTINGYYSLQQMAGIESEGLDVSPQSLLYIYSSYIDQDNSTSIPLIMNVSETSYTRRSIWGTIYGINVSGVFYAEHYGISLHWSPTAGFHEGLLGNESYGGFYAFVSLYDNSSSYGLLGLYAYSYVYAFSIIIDINAFASLNVSWFFDNLVVAVGDPRFVNFTGVPRGGGVEVYDGGVLVGYGNDTDGDGLVSVSISFHPIVRSPRVVVRDSGGDIVFDGVLDEPIVGGQVYGLGYWAGFEASSVLNTSGYKLRSLWLIVYCNASSGLYAYAYNWSSGSFSQLDCSYNGTAWLCPLDIGSYLNPSNNTVVYRVLVSLDSPGSIGFDMANIVAEGLATTAVSDTLFIGVGGSRYIEVYGLSGGELNYLESIEAPGVFNGSSDIAYSVLTGFLYYVDGSGIYYWNSSSSKWVFLTDMCRTSGLGARLEALNTSSSAYLIVVNGTSEPSGYCVVELDSLGNVVAAYSYSLPSSIVIEEFSASAVTPNSSAMFLLAFNTSSGNPVLLRIDTNSPGTVIVLPGTPPGSRSVGLAYDMNNNRLWLMLSGGSIYYYDIATGEWQYYTIRLPFYPLSSGDRLEYYGGELIFVRNDDTNEVWAIPVS